MWVLHFPGAGSGSSCEAGDPQAILPEWSGDEVRQGRPFFLVDRNFSCSVFVPALGADDWTASFYESEERRGFLGLGRRLFAGQYCTELKCAKRLSPKMRKGKHLSGEAPVQWAIPPPHRVRPSMANTWRRNTPVQQGVMVVVVVVVVVVVGTGRTLGSQTAPLLPGYRSNSVTQRSRAGA